MVGVLHYLIFLDFFRHYVAQKKEMDDVRERQRQLREERDVSRNGDSL